MVKYQCWRRAKSQSHLVGWGKCTERQKGEEAGGLGVEGVYVRMPRDEVAVSMKVDEFEFVGVESDLLRANRSDLVSGRWHRQW